MKSDDTSFGIDRPGEMLASNLSSVERLRIKDAIRIENICQPECCLSFGGVNCQSDLPEFARFQRRVR